MQEYQFEMVRENEKVSSDDNFRSLTAEDIDL